MMGKFFKSKVFYILLIVFSFIFLLFVASAIWEDINAYNSKVVLKFVNIMAAMGHIVIASLLIFTFIKILILILNYAAKETHSKIIAIGIVSLFYFQALNAILVAPLMNVTNTTATVVESSVGLPVWREELNDSTVHSSSQSDTSYQNRYDSLGTGISLDGKQALTMDYQLFDDLGDIAIYHTYQCVFILSSFIETLLSIENVRHAAIGFLLLYIIGAMCDNITPNGMANAYLSNFRLWLYQHQMKLLFAAIFLLGGFLSISAIIAIPIVQQGKSMEGLTVEVFNKQIAETYNSYAVMDSTLIKAAKTKSLLEAGKDLDTLRKKVYKLSPNVKHVDSVRFFIYKKEAALKSIDATKLEIEQVINSYTRFEGQARKLLSKFSKDFELERNKIERLYKSSLDDPAVGNARLVFYDDCVQHLEYYGGFYTNKFDGFRKNVEWFVNHNDEMLGNIKYISSSLIDNIQSKNNFHSVSSLSMTPGFSELPEWDDSHSYDYLISQPKLGGNTLDLGYFRLANWLIKIANKEMILITGMLGFGLLGAGISASIRNRNSPLNKLPIFNNSVTSTLIGGVSASLIIFLSAKGGTAIFSTNEIELNIYTLLFVCLIGSVFSETIWEKAYNYINNDASPPESNSPADTKTDVANQPE